MSLPKYLPVNQWPTMDRDAFAAIYVEGDIFDGGAGAGSHLSLGTRRLVETAYCRWLGFLKSYDAGALGLAVTERIARDRVHALVDQLSAEVRMSSVQMYIGGLLTASQLIAPNQDWRWLKRLKCRLAARAVPKDRFHRLVRPWETLDLGLVLMEQAGTLKNDNRYAREIQYRDGLMIALLSVWPIRRRSLAALTVSGHIKRDSDCITIHLTAQDTKQRRAETYRLPDVLVLLMTKYLDEIRPNFPAATYHKGLWASLRRRPLSANRIYDIVRARVRAHFGRDMGLHDFRRAAATFTAMETPEMVGLIPGVLQHASPVVAEQYYNLARSTEASHRFTSLISKRRKELRHQAPHPAR